jgi:ribosome-binding protein aMBF1 (putative translation factor)
MEHQDWTTVYIRKKHENPTDKNVVRQALRNGNSVETVAKVSGEAREYSDRARKLESDLHVSATEAPPPLAALPCLSPSMRQEMIKARTNMKLSQVELAKRLNLNARIIQDLEGGKVVQDRSILPKVSRLLGVSLKFGTA